MNRAFLFSSEVLKPSKIDEMFADQAERLSLQGAPVCVVSLESSKL